MTFCVWPLARAGCFDVYACCGIHQYGITSFGKIIFHCQDLPHLFMQLSTGGHLGCFQLCGIVSSVAINVYLQGSEYLFSVLWGIYLGMEFGGSYGDSV